ncbi:hypothetical protein JAAARDRAFT_87135, partial [Jaapia argillacea MUCL 33604]
WRCKSCFRQPIFCYDCIRWGHLRSPFHRVERWGGEGYFVPAWLSDAGVHLHLGHRGKPCP